MKNEYIKEVQHRSHFYVVIYMKFPHLQDVSQDKIPIMLVGNKTDLRQEALQDGVTCITTSYGEKLARVRGITIIELIFKQCVLNICKK